MQIKQEITGYKKDYLRKEWLERKSSHYVFYYLKNSLAEKDIDKIVESGEIILY